MSVIEHYKAALERIVFVHADAPEVPAADLADIAGEALDTAPDDQLAGAVSEIVAALRERYKSPDDPKANDYGRQGREAADFIERTFGGQYAVSDKQDVAEALADARARTIGPVNSALMAAAKGIEVFFKVNWNDTLDRVVGLSGKSEGTFVNDATQWGVIKDGGADRIFLTLLIEWPVLEEEVLLFFEVETFRHELEFVRDAHGTMTLIPNVKIKENPPSVTVTADDEFLATVLEASAWIRDHS